MRHTLELKTVCENNSEKDQLLKLFIPEDKKLSNGRAEYSIEENELEIFFKVNANDAVALRAIMTSITKTLDVFERMKKIVQE